jgi:magnesium-transporting ATPase (P-type)
MRGVEWVIPEDQQHTALSRKRARERRLLDAYCLGGLVTIFATGTEPNAFDESKARTMAFTTLMMYQLFDVYNCRSRRRSAFKGFLENKWLLVAIAFSLGTHILIIYLPAAQTAFHTVPLTLRTGWSRPASLHSCCSHGVRQERSAGQRRADRRESSLRYSVRRNVPSRRIVETGSKSPSGNIRPDCKVFGA